MLTLCLPSSKCVPSGNNGEVQDARKGTGHHSSHADGSGQMSLIGTPLRTKAYGTTFTLLPHNIVDFDGRLMTDYKINLTLTKILRNARAGNILGSVKK